MLNLFSLNQEKKDNAGKVRFSKNKSGVCALLYMLFYYIKKTQLQTPKEFEIDGLIV